MMKASRVIWTSLLAGMAALAQPTPQANAQDLVLQPESALWLAGDSTLHPFTCRTQEMKLVAELDPKRGGSATNPEERLKAVLNQGAMRQFQLVIPVKTLKSKDAKLDKNMYNALEAEKYPEIVFELSSYEVRPSTVSASVYQVQGTGMLQIAGVQKTIQLNSTVTQEPATLRLQGQYPLLMTDYGVKPPKLMMGAIKVRNQVVIHFDLRLR